ncbi:MAG: ShlB/FhaC/HecB family hemolysin secretion/activation protein [Acidaminococcaceae bacterium]|nr:ShlB/FhaC/HecB family hemolysin secretion/activation protein [Acidaminococcaceae bacterium]
MNRKMAKGAVSQFVIFTGSLTLLCVLSFPFAVNAATAVPQPGESIRDTRPRQQVSLEHVDTDNKQAPRSVRFTLQEIRVEHEGLHVKDEKITAITDKIIGKEITAAELNAAVADITHYVRSYGYPAAAAYIPEQTAVDGRLLVKVEPGRIGKVQLVNESGLKDKAAERMLAGLKPGDIIRTRKVENSLYNLRDLSGVEVQGVLSPGAEQGTSDITVRVTNKKKTSVVLYSENYGSESAGRYRYGLQGEVRNLSGTGDRLNLGALLSNKQQHNYNISYETTLGRSASRLGLGFSRADYDLGNVFAALGAEGVANTYSLYGRTTLWNTSGSALALTYGYDYRDITDELKTFGVSWKKHSHVVHLGLDGFGRGSRSRVQYNATVYTGKLVPDSEMADILGTLGRTKGHFTKVTADVTAVQGIGRNFDVLLKLSGQKAANNLDSSEHIILGGARGVRAYPQGEASGDEGMLGTLELRYHTPVKGLVLSTYFDAGHVRVEKEAGDSMTLKGWGIGLTYSKPDDWFARFDYARRIGSDDAMSDEARSRQRMWFIAGKVF